MPGSRVRVWVGDGAEQHLAAAPKDDTAGEWTGETVCGVEGRLRWIHQERVDNGAACERCVALEGVRPPLEGGDAGPV